MKKPNRYIVSVVFLIILVEILILKPSELENTETSTPGMFGSIASQLEAQKINDDVKYRLDVVKLTVVEHGLRQREMDAQDLVVYEKSNKLVANVVKIKLYDSNKKFTLITSDREYYDTVKRESELVGNLVITFPDGFKVKTEKARYSLISEMFVTDDSFFGESPNQPNEDQIKVWGKGFLGGKQSPILNVKSESRVQTKKSGTNETSDVRSDFAEIDRLNKTGVFSMNAVGKYVDSLQGTLSVKSAKQRIVYNSEKNTAQYMVAEGNVYIKENDPQKSQEGLKYATCQKADFYNFENKIVLSEFPSVYQENDTITGDQITIFRDKNIVEVSEASAYHEGTEQ